MITCRECQKHLIAYLHRDLPAWGTRQVAAHLDHCPACRFQYERERQLADELRHIVPSLGQQVRPPAFDQVWAAMRRDPMRPLGSQYSLQYGMAMLVVTLLLLIPFALGKSHYVLAAPPTQPPPLVRVTATGTETTARNVSLVARINQTPAPAQLPSTVHIDTLSTP